MNEIVIFVIEIMAYFPLRRGGGLLMKWGGLDRACSYSFSYTATTICAFSFVAKHLNNHVVHSFTKARLSSFPPQYTPPSLSSRSRSPSVTSRMRSRLCSKLCWFLGWSSACVWCTCTLCAVCGVVTNKCCPFEPWPPLLLVIALNGSTSRGGAFINASLGVCD